MHMGQKQYLQYCQDYSFSTVARKFRKYVRCLIDEMYPTCTEEMYFLGT